MAKPTRLKFMTPRGVLRFPNLHAPSTKFQPDGEYTADTILDPNKPEVVKLMADMDAVVKQAKDTAEAAFAALAPASRKRIGEIKLNPPYSEVYDRDTEEPTGEIVIKVKMKASGTYAETSPAVRSGKKSVGEKWYRKPKVFDIKGKPLEDVPNVGSGTVAKVAFEVSPNRDGGYGYFVPSTGSYGIKLELAAVQLIELQVWGDEDAGFGDESGEADSDSSSTDYEDDIPF